MIMRNTQSKHSNETTFESTTNLFDRVKTNVPIEDVYREVTGRDPSGHGSQWNVRCPLPDHDDQDPSASLNVQQNTWFCQVCHEGGTVIDLWMAHRGGDALSAARDLAQNYGIVIDELSEDQQERLRAQQEKKSTFQNTLQKVIKAAHENLRPTRRQHLTKRGLSEETINEQRIGFIDEGISGVLDTDYKKIGAISDWDKNLLKDRYLIPIYEFGSPVYWVGYDPESDRKYLFPSGNEDFLKKPLWGWDQVSSDDPIHLVEGVFDHLSMNEAGLQSVCLLGTNLSEDQENPLERMMGDDVDLRIVFDNDAADDPDENDDNDDNPGLEAAEKLAETLWPDVQAQIVELTVNDVNDLWSKVLEDRERFQQELRKASSGTLLDRRLNELDNDEGVSCFRMAKSSIYPLLWGLEEDLRDYYLPKLREALDNRISESALRRGIQKAKRKQEDGPKQFFEGTRFVPSRLGNHLLEETSVLYTGETFYRYDDGVYKPDGRDHLSRRVQELLGEEWSRHHWEQIRTWMKQRTTQSRVQEDITTPIINVQNGMVNLQTGERSDHDPSHRSLVQHPVVYNPEAECPKLDEFVRSVVVPRDLQVQWERRFGGQLRMVFDPDNTFEEEPLSQKQIQLKKRLADVHRCVKLLWEFAGYCLLRPLQLKKVLILTGRGDNGKSALLNVMFERPLGTDYVAHESLQQLSDNRFSSANLFGKVANIVADLEAKEVQQTGLFKQLTGGDTIRAERKHRETFQFTNHARLLFSANELPPIRDYSEAFFNRLLILPCPNRFQGDDRDPNIVDDLTTEEARSHWLNRAIEGARRLLKNQQFTMPDRVKQAVREYQLKSNSVAAFLDECTEDNPGSAVPKKKLYKAYERWCEEYGMHAKKYRTFCSDAQKAPHGLESGRRGSRGEQKRCFLEIELTVDVSTPSSPSPNGMHFTRMNLN